MIDEQRQDVRAQAAGSADRAGMLERRSRSNRSASSPLRTKATRAVSAGMYDAVLMLSDSRIVR